MKKTIVALLALGGIAMGAIPGSETLVLGKTDTTNPWGVGEYVTHGDGVPSGPTNNAVIVSGTLASGITYEMKHNAGRTWIRNIDDNWTNQAALDEYNRVLGYKQELESNLTLEALTSGTLSASAAGGSYETMTLNFNGATDAYWTAGAAIQIYALVGASKIDNGSNNLNKYTVTGLDNMNITTASATGSGFDDAYSAAGSVTLVKITGNLQEDMVVSLYGNGAKTGFAALTISAIPEPTTATLSLLALAGLAARRRRK